MKSEVELLMKWKYTKILYLISFCLLLSVQTCAHILPHGFATDVQQRKVETVQSLKTALNQLD